MFLYLMYNYYAWCMNLCFGVLCQIVRGANVVKCQFVLFVLIVPKLTNIFLIFSVRSNLVEIFIDFSWIFCLFLLLEFNDKHLNTVLMCWLCYESLV